VDSCGDVGVREHGFEKYGAEGLIASSVGLGWSGLSAALRTYGRGVIAYQDALSQVEIHVLTGGPGLGNNGTAGEFKGPWKIIVLVYNPTAFNDPAFIPIKSATDVDAAEINGTFLPINPTGANPYEVDTGNVLICPLVSPNA